MKINYIRLGTVVGVAVLVVTLSACGSNSKFGQKWNDAPTKGSPDESAAKVVAMPDGFNNVAIKCINGTAIVTAFHGNSAYGAIAVSEHSALCS